MGPAPHDHAADDSDLDSNAPLLPAPVSSSSNPPAPAHDNTSSRPRGRTAWAWVVIGCFGVGLLWLAFGTSYLDRRDRDERWEDDPAFPSRVGFEGPTPTVRPSSSLCAVKLPLTPLCAGQGAVRRSDELPRQL